MDMELEINKSLEQEGFWSEAVEEALSKPPVDK